MPKPKTSTPKVAKERQESDLSVAVREVRLAYAESQQRFAERLGTSLVSVNRWELGHQEPASLIFLTRLRDLALDRNLEKTAKLFNDAVEKFIGPLRTRKREILSGDDDLLSEDEAVLVAIARIAPHLFPDEYKALINATPQTRLFVEKLAKVADANLEAITKELMRSKGDDTK